jgi:phage major head subunit gpT-like protein
MIISSPVLNGLRTALRDEFRKRMSDIDAKSVWRLLATIITSNTKSNTYAWLGAFPQLREWVGDRVVKDIAESAYIITNKKYEATLGVDRADIEDDNLGQYRVLAAEMADELERFFNRQIASLLKDGFTNTCYDGQCFFDEEHPVYEKTDGTGTYTPFSNLVAIGETSGSPWFLLSLSGSLKPLILQQRSAPEFEEITDTKNDTVFMQDKYLYGIRYRGNFGYGLWQQAVGSKSPLTADHFQIARGKMQSLKRDGGDPLGIVPTHLVVGPSHEAAARKIVEAQFLANGASNIYYKTAELVILPHLA